jgi:hypothetical protein
MLEGTDLMSAYQTLSSKEESYETASPININTPIKEEKPIQIQNQQNQLNSNDQQLNMLVAQLKEKKAAAAANAQAQPVQVEQPSYFDKLFGKKKEVYKVLQLSLMITLGISIHFLIDHYLTKYLADNEMSFERQLILRLMYPLAVLFILWNLRVFVK